MTKEQFLSFWSKPESKDMMSEHLDLYAKEVIDDQRQFICGDYTQQL